MVGAAQGGAVTGLLLARPVAGFASGLVGWRALSLAPARRC